MIPTIFDLRLSFIWVETFLDLLDEPLPPAAPFNFLGRAASYRQMFEKVVQGNGVPEGLTVPWHQPAGKSFWKYYLENRNPDSINGNQAFRAVVPFRKRVPARIKASWLPGRIFPESFFYPHGTALIITVRYTGSLTLPAAVDITFKVRQEDQFDVEWADGRVEQLPLDTIAEKCLDLLRETALGPQTSSGLRSTEPFSILTVVQGDNVDPQAALVEDGEVHRALEAITAWDRDAQYYELPTLADAGLKLKKKFASHVLYATRRGRAIWFPHRFMQRTLPRRPLACYHRNLVATSLQVESLSSLAVVVAEERRKRDWRTVTLRDYTRRAVDMLGLLYGGVRGKTYRTWSPRAQIDQNDLVANINAVRTDLGLEALH